MVGVLAGRDIGEMFDLLWTELRPSFHSKNPHYRRQRPEVGHPGLIYTADLAIAQTFYNPADEGVRGSIVFFIPNFSMREGDVQACGEDDVVLFGSCGGV
jgi:hypothetical protein